MCDLLAVQQLGEGGPGVDIGRSDDECAARGEGGQNFLEGRVEHR